MYKHKEGMTFRKLERSDLDLLQSLRNSSWFGTHSTTFVNKEDQQKWFDKINSSNDCLVYHCQSSVGGEFVGIAMFSNINWISRVMDITGYVTENSRKYAKSAWCAGYDLAFEMLNAHRINAEVVETNTAAYFLDTMVGCKFEGRKRKSVYKCGKYYDSIVLGILREDWENTQRVKDYGGICNLNWEDRGERVKISDTNALLQ